VTYRRSLALSFMLAAVACGSGGGSGEPFVVGPEDPAYNEEAPAYNFWAPGVSYPQAPHNATEQPAYNPDAPPGGGESPGGGGGPTPTPGTHDCPAICDALIAGQCEVDSREECIAGCTSFPQEFGVCSDEFFAMLVCVIDAPGFMCVDGRLDSESFAEICYSEALAYSECEDANEPEPEPEPEPTQCVYPECACDDVCDVCLCAFQGDTASCTDFCL
jgi:hypothetical protein